MASLNKNNSRYFKMAKAVYEGKVVLQKQDLKTFIKCIKELTDPRFRGMADPITDTRNDPIDPHYLGEEGQDIDVEKNPVAKTFQQKGNFDQYVDKFSGLEFKPMETESITNYSNSKPTKMDKFSIRYETSDGFNNNTVTVIKKLREGNDLVFTVFQNNLSQNNQAADSAATEENDITVNKSTSFRDEIEGGKILADMLAKLEI